MKYLTVFFQYALIITLIIEFCTPYICFPIVSDLIGYVIILFLIILIMLEGKLDVATVRFSALIMFGGLIPLLNVATSKIAYIKLFLLMLPLSIIYTEKLLVGDLYNLNKFFIRYENVMLLLAISSLFFWIFGTIYEIIPYTILIPNDWFSDRFIPTYYGIYFETQETMLGALGGGTFDTLYRNTGFFNEAPMYNMNLCFALSIECFIRKNMSFARIFLLIVTILTTFSTTGYFFLLLLVFGGFYFYRNSFRVSIVKLLVIPILIMFFLVSSALMSNKSETDESSLNNRTEDIIKCVEVGLENPFIGVGIFHVAKEYGSSKENFGFSNSIFTTFAHGGAYFFLFYICALLVFPLYIFRRVKKKWPFFILCYFFLFAFTLSLYWYLTIFMVSMGLVCFHKRKLLVTEIKVS